MLEDVQGDWEVVNLDSSLLDQSQLKRPHFRSRTLVCACCPACELRRYLGPVLRFDQMPPTSLLGRLAQELAQQ